MFFCIADAFLHQTVADWMKIEEIVMWHVPLFVVLGMENVCADFDSQTGATAFKIRSIWL